TWLRAHPEVTVVARDRADAYASGVTQGAPDAVQVADRWHVLKNLREAVEVELCQHPMLPWAPPLPEAASLPPAASVPPVVEGPPRRTPGPAGSGDVRWQRYRRGPGRPSDPAPGAV